MTYRFCTTLAAGCHGKPFAPIISRHRTLEAAIKKASRNDRLEVYALESGVGGDWQSGPCLYRLPSQGDKVLGPGRYGNSPRA